MGKTVTHGLLFCAALFLLAVSAWAAELEGFSSADGALPIGAGGKASLWVWPQEGTNPTGNVGIGTGAATAPQASLEVKRGVKLGTDEAQLLDPTNCAGLSKKGTLSYYNGSLYLCDGTNWKVIGAQ